MSLYRVHQDLKLDNILIARGSSDSNYDFVPILTDFGHSYFRPMLQEHENGLVPDRHGNQEFGKATAFTDGPQIASVADQNYKPPPKPVTMLNTYYSAPPGSLQPLTYGQWAVY